MQVDLTPVVQATVGLLAVTMSVVVPPLLKAVAAHLNIQISAAQSAAFDEALNKAISYGAVKAEAEISAKGWDHPDVKSVVLATAVDYITAKMPDALAAVGLSADPLDMNNRRAILQALQRALPAAFTTLAASPATPPATAPGVLPPQTPPVAPSA